MPVRMGGDGGGGGHGGGFGGGGFGGVGGFGGGHIGDYGYGGGYVGGKGGRGSRAGQVEIARGFHDGRLRRRERSRFFGYYDSLYEHPRCQVPRHPLSIFLSSCCVPLSLVRPRRRLSPAPTAYCRRPARADAVKAGRFFSGHHPPGGLGFTAIEHDGRLDGSGGSITLLSVIYLSRVSASAALFR
jgi:hypothetical protein